MTNDIKSERRQVRINSISSLVYFVLNAAVGLWLVPYLIGEIGVDGYGLIALAVSLTAYVALAAGSVNSSISRFLSIDINRDDFDSANETFNSALLGVSIGILLVFPILWVLAANIGEIVKVSPRFADSAPDLFLLLIIAFFITFVRNIFTAPAFAKNRLDLIFFGQGLETLIKVGVLVVLMGILASDVDVVGYATLIGAVIALFYGLALWRKFAPYLTVSLKALRFSRFSELFAMSGWITVNQTGAILFLNVDLLIANLFIGATGAGYFGALLQLSIALRSLSAVLAGVVTPLVFSRYAKDRTDELVAVARTGIKYLGLLVALPVGVVCAAAHPLLTLWLGEEFAEFAPLVWFMMFHLAANVAVRPLFAVQQAANSVRGPAIVTLLLGASHVVLSIVFVTLFDWGLYGIAISGIITLSLKNSIYTLIHAARLLQQPFWTFAGPVLAALASATIAALVFTAIRELITVDSWVMLIVASGVTTLIYVGFAWTVILGNEDRVSLRESLLSGF